MLARVRAALDNIGYVDGTVDGVARDVVKAEEVIDYTQKSNLAERLAKRFGAEWETYARKTGRWFGRT
mgnify:CR=1 FL=1